MRTIVACAAVSLAFLLSGCSTGTVPGLPGTSNVVAMGAHGIVRGGQQPVTGSTITLWPVGTTGYGTSATALATTTTDANGAFSITNSYTCPVSDPYVYITSTGGNPGLAPGTNNTAISLMAALTDCNTLKANAASTYIVINEVTTVASVYALAQFMNTSTGAIGSWSYANTGMKNAFSTVTNLVSNSTGAALATTPNGNGVVPQSEINTLADVLAPCVNTSSSGSTECATLFGDVQGSPGNTLQVALEIALHPGSNVAALFGISVGTPPFVPTLSSAPNDWTVALAFNDGGGAAPRQIAIDGLGNVWTTNFNSGGTNSTLSKINTLGVPQNGSPFHTNMNGVSGLAIDIANDAWVGNIGNGTLVGYSNAGGTFFGPVSGLSTPLSMAFDSNGFLWISNYGSSSVAEFNPGNGSFISTGFTGGITAPFAIGADTSNNIWVGNASTVTELNIFGAASSGSPLSSGGITSPSGIAIDGSNNVWISNYPTGNVAELNSSGTAVSTGSGYSGGGLGPSGGVAIDGAGNAWVTDRSLNQLTEFNSSGTALTPSTGYQGGSLNGPRELAIDQSGNVWVEDNNVTTTGSINTTISEFVGLAKPVYTPLSLALTYNQFAKTPGTPIAVSLVSTAVPYYTPGTAYSAQLFASGGNSGSFTYSSSSTFPTGLSISSAGLISGTTSATGSTTVTVQACDSQNLTNCGTQSYNLTANTTLTALGNESALNGSYAMEFEGYRNGSSTAKVYGNDILASLNFNGSGTITGEIDVNHAQTGSLLNGTVTGYYAFGSDNRGTMVITRSGGSPIEFAIVGENFSAGKPQTLRLVEFDDTAISTDGVRATGSGIAKLQTSAAFSSATLNQSFAFGMQGETPCNNDSGVNPSCATISPFGALSVAGQFTGNNSNSITSGEEDAAGVNNTWNTIGLSGSYTNPDSSGRGTLTLTPSGSTYPAAGQNFVYYIVNSGEMFLMTADGHLTKSLLTGDAVVQSASLSNSTLTGNYVAWEESPNNGDGVNYLSSDLDSSLIYLAVQSGSQITATIDENNGGSGTVTTEQTQGPFPYSVASNGRMTIAGGGGGTPVFYVAGSGQFFGTEQPSSSNQGGPALITGLQQTSGSFACPASGTYGVGTLLTPMQSSIFTGIYTGSTGAILVDYSDFNGVLVQGMTGTSTCTTDSQTSTTGRFVLSTSFSVYGSSTGYDAVYPVVPNSKYIMLSIRPGDGRPSIITVDK